MSVSYHHGMAAGSSSAAAGSQYRIPDELQEILLDFTVNYLIEQPSDIARFGVEYFVKLTAARNGNKNNEEEASDDESMLSDEEIRRNGLNIQGAARRKSVFAETYDPEEEEDESNVVYPKSDGQRKALKESVKEILLFRSLESDQLNEVLDAMFEYKVKAGDSIIRQGDDGDNFYVVERGLYNIYVNTASGNQMVGKCDGTGSFGELALMYNSEYYDRTWSLGAILFISFNCSATSGHHPSGCGRHPVGPRPSDVSADRATQRLPEAQDVRGAY